MNTEDYLAMILGEMISPKEKLPLPDEVSYYELEKRRILYVDFNIGLDCMAIERMILRWNLEDAERGIPPEQRKPIRLFVHSYGGDLDFMWGMIDAIETSVTPVYTINVGTAASAAGLIFMAGHRRFMTPRATVLIHEGSASMSGDATKVLDASDNYRKSLKKMKDYIEAHTRIPSKLLNKKRNNDWELDADFCLENGVCDAVIKSVDEVIL